MPPDVCKKPSQTFAPGTETLKVPFGATLARSPVSRQPRRSSGRAASAASASGLAAESGRYDLFVALGVVISGETYHFEIVANESARGIMALTMDGVAIGNGVLTTEDEAQAIVRADPAQLDKGGAAAKAALALLDLRDRLG